MFNHARKLSEAIEELIQDTELTSIFKMQESKPELAAGIRFIYLKHYYPYFCTSCRNVHTADSYILRWKNHLDYAAVESIPVQLIKKHEKEIAEYIKSFE